jgi:23S rRNA (cytosine1962-C5)-methyltransferase
MSSSLATLVLKPGREKSLKRRHPWVFSGAVAQIKGEAASGATLRVVGASGEFLALAAYSPQSQIIARAWSFDEGEVIDAAFIRARIAASIARRELLFEPQRGQAPGLASARTSNAMRLIHAESDGLPALIVDRYADTLVVQFLSAGIDAWRDLVVSALHELTGCTCIYERSDAEVRELEGLEARVGALVGPTPAQPVAISEHDTQFLVDVVQGQKTGFYLDQRENRRRVRQLAYGRRTLNAFCYTGGFSIAALQGGATSVVSIDSSGPALELARKHVELNALDAAKAQWLEGDVFQLLRKQRDARGEFDLIILDPPKFAPTAAHAEKAARAYKDINLLALKLLARDGLLVTFSCSGGVNADLFQKIVAGAAVDAGVDAQILDRLGAATDHPVSIHFPEGEYLKGLVLRRLT